MWSGRPRGQGISSRRPRGAEYYLRQWRVTAACSFQGFYFIDADRDAQDLLVEGGRIAAWHRPSGPPRRRDVKREGKAPGAGLRERPHPRRHGPPPGAGRGTARHGVAPGEDMARRGGAPAGAHPLGDPRGRPGDGLHGDDLFLRHVLRDGRGGQGRRREGHPVLPEPGAHGDDPEKVPRGRGALPPMGRQG